MIYPNTIFSVIVYVYALIIKYIINMTIKNIIGKSVYEILNTNLCIIKLIVRQH